jgi:hypothetical protein
MGKHDHFTLDLDTTNPSIILATPNYGVKNKPMYIRVESDKPLDSFQFMYMIDANRNTHPITLSHEGTYYAGLIDLTNLPKGVTRVYARVRDELHNVSDEIYQAFYLAEKTSVNVKLNLSVRDIHIHGTLQTVETDVTFRSVHIDSNTRNIRVESTSREIEQSITQRHTKIGIKEKGDEVDNLG